MTLDMVLESLHHDMELSADATKGELISKIQFAQKELQRALDALKQDDRVTNSLGILQSLGADIDRLAGVYDAQQKAINSVSLHTRWIKEALEKEV